MAKIKKWVLMIAGDQRFIVETMSGVQLAVKADVPVQNIELLIAQLTENIESTTC